MSPDPNAEAEASTVVRNLQTGEYIFLDEEARKIIDNNGRTLLEKFLTHKQLYLTWPSITKSELVVSAFLESVTEARIHGVLIDRKARSYFLMVDDETEKIVNKLIEKINTLNTLCKNKFGCALFVNDAKLMLNLKHPVGNEPEFVFKVATIACIIDNIHRDDVTNLIKDTISLAKSDGKIGSITLIEALLKEKGVETKDPVGMLRQLNKIRSKMPPIHRAEHDLIGTYRNFGIKWPIQEWSTAGGTCLQYFLKAIECLHQQISI